MRQLSYAPIDGGSLWDGGKHNFLKLQQLANTSYSVRRLKQQVTSRARSQRWFWNSSLLPFAVVIFQIIVYCLGGQRSTIIAIWQCTGNNVALLPMTYRLVCNQNLEFLQSKPSKNKRTSRGAYFYIFCNKIEACSLDSSMPKQLVDKSPSWIAPYASIFLYRTRLQASSQKLCPEINLPGLITTIPHRNFRILVTCLTVPEINFRL